MVLCAMKNPDIYKHPKDFIDHVRENYFYSSTDKCLVTMSTLSLEVTRPVVDCNICKHVTEVSPKKSLFATLIKVNPKYVCFQSL